jgi:hypothetical protein
VSLPSLLGVGTEYYDNSIALFERLRQLEEDAVHVLGNFSPVSFLLMSDEYITYLRLMLLEALSTIQPEPFNATAMIERLLQILQERRATVAKRHTPIVSIINVHDIERFLRFGLVGRFGLPEAVVAERRQAARREFEHIIRILQRPALGTQVGLIEELPAAQTFQIFEKADGAAVTLSPYRLGHYPNITSGIATITTAPEAVRLFKDTIIRHWDRAHKGESGADILRAILERIDRQE